MRKCVSCKEPLPPNTTHFYDNEDNEYYCTDCIEAKPYTAYTYYRRGEFIGTDENISKVEDYEDDYYRED